eukprot:15469598-Alexandrium_andersonii.AAC.1
MLLGGCGDPSSLFANRVPATPAAAATPKAASAPTAKLSPRRFRPGRRGRAMVQPSYKGGE